MKRLSKATNHMHTQQHQVVQSFPAAQQGIQETGPETGLDAGGRGVLGLRGTPGTVRQFFSEGR